MLSVAYRSPLHSKQEHTPTFATPSLIYAARVYGHRRPFLCLRGVSARAVPLRGAFCGARNVGGTRRDADAQLRAQQTRTIGSRQ